MGEQALVDNFAEETDLLVSYLDNNQRECDFVVWLYFPDMHDWRLLLAGGWIDSLLPKDEATAYRHVAEAINECALENISISEVKLVKTSDHTVGAVQMLVGTEKGPLSQIHFGGNMLNGMYLGDMIIMRS